MKPDRAVAAKEGMDGKTQKMMRTSDEKQKGEVTQNDGVCKRRRGEWTTRRELMTRTSDEREDHAAVRVRVKHYAACPMRPLPRVLAIKHRNDHR